MKVSDLITLLTDLVKEDASIADAIVVQSRDSEGNGFSPTYEPGLNRYKADTSYSGEIFPFDTTLTEDMKEQGLTEDDLAPADAVPCLTLWPTN